MSEFEVRKNTLPYVQPYSVIHTPTGNVLGQYKTIKKAQEAITAFKKQGINGVDGGTPPGFESVWKTIGRRMRRPDGDKPIQPPKRRGPKRRRVELDE